MIADLLLPNFFSLTRSTDNSAQGVLVSKGPIPSGSYALRIGAVPEQIHPLAECIHASVDLIVLIVKLFKIIEAS